jgi:uncharacterized protein (TIGR00369 family)
MELNNPFLERLGVTLADWREDHVELRLHPTEVHGNRTGIAQGGVVAALLDAACGYAGLFAPDGTEQEHATTITLSISYIAPAKLFEPLYVHGRVTGWGQSIYYSSAEARDKSGAVIASAQGAFKCRRQ